MPVLGSSLVNTSGEGQPSDAEDRPFSYAVGTQVFINPEDQPTDAVVKFKASPGLLNGTLLSGVSNLSIGFATNAELNNLASWEEAYISEASGNRFAVGFGRLTTNPQVVSVNVQGASVSTISRPQAATAISEAENTLTLPGHAFVTGDRVRLSSTDTLPQGLNSSISYYIIRTGTNTAKLASSYTAAVGNSEVDIQSLGSGTITVYSDEEFTLTRAGSTGVVTLKKGTNIVATFTEQNVASPLRLFYWCREQSASNTEPLLKEIKVRGAI